MKNTCPAFTSEQWHFLAALEALGGTVQINILDQIAPLTAGQLMDLWNKTADLDLLRQNKGEEFSLNSAIPEILERKIIEINSRKNLAGLVEAIYTHKIDKMLDPRIFISLLDRAGMAIEASRREFELADRENANVKNAIKLHKGYMNALQRLKNLEMDSNTLNLYITYSLKVANLCFIIGQGINELGEILDEAYMMANKLGDKRSQSLIKLKKGMLYYFTNRPIEAFTILSAGVDEVNELGDEDILSQSAVQLALLYYMKGEFAKVIKHLEFLENLISNTNNETHALSYIMFSYSLMYLGQFHRAFGFLNSNLRLAEETNNKSLSTWLRVALGTSLVLVKKYDEAEFHLKKARQESIEAGDAFRYHYVGGSLAYLYFMTGNQEMSYQIVKNTVEKAIENGLIDQFASPWIPEMLYEFHRLGYEPIPRWNFSEIQDTLLKGINIHLKGVALRLKAREMMDQGDVRKDLIKADLDASRKCLELSGNHIQLAKTVLELAHLELLHNNKEAARGYTQEAWRIFGGHAEDYFPDQYKSLLETKQLFPDTQQTKDEYIQRYFEELNSIKSEMGQEKALLKIITATKRFFGAERGGLFLFNEKKQACEPELRTAINLTKEEVKSSRFKPCMEYIFKAYRTNKPLVVRKDDKVKGDIVRSVLCIPFYVQGIKRGVLYHDNSYMMDAFDFLDPMMMKLLSRHTSDMVDFFLDNLKTREENKKLSMERTALQQSSEFQLIAESRVVRELMSQASEVASIDMTVLLTGETGTGKGMFAQWIHKNSRRSTGPFIVVDCTTIPENLVESELFGYEKGAFTGADKQKLGRVELAHKGTLFLDEIGEVPLYIQKKLLKTLEEKTFVRIGGGRVISSDFRLIAATNRNLKEEVSSGRFREDLYFRLNVFPLAIPPLREREDIPELARYFLDLYAKKYERPNISISDKDLYKLTKYNWPGNVRELKNVIERAVILSKGKEFRMPSLLADSRVSANFSVDDLPTLDELQRRYIRYVIGVTNKKIAGTSGAAEILGMKRTSLYSRMKILGIKDNI
jgi:transcriptional regulator with GAF, ATPase, and Fis domain